MLPDKMIQKKGKSPEEALTALMRLAARAEKCQSDAMRLMHNWGLNDSQAQQVLDRLLRDRFIDDSRYAEAFVREKLRLSGWGEYKIRTALQRKGIDNELIREALRQADPPLMERRLTEQLSRKARNVKRATPYELRNKLIRYGLSLGYNYETVSEQVSRLIKETEPCDDFSY